VKDDKRRRHGTHNGATQPALQIIQQDRQALEALLTKYSPAMYRAALRKLGNRPYRRSRNLLRGTWARDWAASSPTSRLAGFASGMDDYGQDTSGERPANRHPLGLTGAVAALADTLFPATSLSSSLAQDFSPGTPALLRVGLLHPALATVAACYVMWVIFEKLNRAKPTLTIRHRSYHPFLRAGRSRHDECITSRSRLGPDRPSIRSRCALDIACASLSRPRA
jgi:hypothetical protein